MLTPHVAGRSLRTALGGAPLDEEPSFAESLVPLIHYGWSDLRAVRDGRWKYILAPRPELYDLSRDPGELQNLVDREPQRARALSHGHRAAPPPEQAALRDGERPATRRCRRIVLEKLGALGYVSMAGSSASKTSGADPKDKIDEYQVLNTLMREGLIGLREGRFAASLGRFQKLFDLGIDSFEAHYYAARALAGLKRWREAAVHFEGALAEAAGVHRGVSGPGRRTPGRRRRPIWHSTRSGAGRRRRPTIPRLIEREGDITRRLGDAAQADSRLRARRRHGSRRTR